MAKSAPAPSSTTLFIIDSDADFCAWAAGHLKADNVSISTFTKAEDALAAYQKRPAEIVICDLRLPNISGIEVLKKLRQIDPNAMVILTSAIAGTSSVIDAMRLGAYDFLPKEKLT